MNPSLRLIAHRVFDDQAPIEACAWRPADFLHGVELDVRCDEGGEAWVDHAPVFLYRRSLKRRAPKAFNDAMTFLAGFAPRLTTVMIDVKSRAAAQAVARRIVSDPPPFETVFTCWRTEDALALRTALPDARILFCLAPIFARRAPRGRLRDLYLYNSYPFVATRRGFEPNEEKPNRHNINVKLISSRELKAFVPPHVDGVCVHRIFASQELAQFAAKRDLRVAVYGLSRRRPGRIREIAQFADYAIIRDGWRRRRAETMHNLDRATGT